MINTFFIYICAISLVVMTIPFFPVVLIGGRRAKEVFVKNWARLTILAFQSKVNFKGEENLPNSDEKKVLYLANHSSLLDIPILFGWVDNSTAFVSKKSLLYVPVVGLWMIMLGCVFLNRKPTRAELEKFEIVKQRVKKGNRYFLFPEGTRSRTGKLKRFRSVKRLMDIEGLLVVPVHISGTYDIANPGSFRLKPGTVEVVIGAPTRIGDRDAGDALEIIEKWMKEMQIEKLGH